MNAPSARSTSHAKLVDITVYLFIYFCGTAGIDYAITIEGGTFHNIVNVCMYVWGNVK